MKKWLAIVLISIFTLLCLAWLRPRVFDEKLIFQPTPLPEETFTGAELRKLRREALEDTTFFTRAENTNTIRRLIDSRDLTRYCIALNFINLSMKRGGKFPEEFRNKNFLRSKLVDCLKAEVYQLYYVIEKHPYSDYCSDCSSVDEESVWSKMTTKIIFRFLKEFTFQKNKTLNQFWTRVIEFERNEDSKISENYDFHTYSTSNFYGEMFLSIAMPSVEQTVKLIETTSAQSSNPTNLCPASAPVVDGR